jgi:N-acetylmuramoyl-L-alanine amidase
VNNQDFDLVIHIHFNDYRGHKRNKIGKYTGFSVYVPDKLFENYELSRALGESIFNEIKKVQTVSTLDKEKKGIIEDQELIAVGANASLEAGSVLIEYGYIYEDKIFDEKKRAATLDDFAYATYVGIKDLLKETPAPKSFLSR